MLNDSIQQAYLLFYLILFESLETLILLSINSSTRAFSNDCFCVIVHGNIELPVNEPNNLRLCASVIISVYANRINFTLGHDALLVVFLCV